MRHRQSGITFIGWVVLLLPLAIVALAGIRVTPAFLNYTRVARAIEQTANEYQGSQSVSREALKVALEKRFDVDYVENPKIQDIAITKTGDGWVIEADYEEVVPLVANASLLLVFNKSATVAP
jgi:hypothetical protein